MLSAPKWFSQDGWLALVAGRRIAVSGLPHVDDLTIWGSGAPWIDQQWLAHLLMYWAHEGGGLPLVTGLSALLGCSGVALAVAAGRSLGGSERHAVLLLVPALVLTLPFLGPARTQAFAFPLFAAVLWLLARPSAPADRRTLLVIPLLALWANLHGSVVVGAGLGSLLGATALVEMAMGRRPRQSAWVPALLVASPVVLLCTPYGLDAADYYRATLIDRSFTRLVSEWQPPFNAVALALPLLAVGFAGLWILGRSGRRTPLFHHAAFAVLLVSACFTTRSVPWLAIAALIILPSAMRVAFGARAAPPRRPTVNLALAGAALVFLLVAAIATGVRGAAPYESRLPPSAASVVGSAAAADPQLQVFATERYADWLMWEQPALAGRVLYDIRFEVLPEERLKQLAVLGSDYGARFRFLLGRARLAVIEADGYRAFARSLARDASADVLYRHGDLLIVRLG